MLSHHEVWYVIKPRAFQVGPSVALLESGHCVLIGIWSIARAMVRKFSLFRVLMFCAAVSRDDVSLVVSLYGLLPGLLRNLFGGNR
ncbi:hypothetical protein EDB19DRAFT_385037 [Suillus lakei]|nr:hypothetical protein EDB19DRAFT_385037 [Suillus lakei]